MSEPAEGPVVKQEPESSLAFEAPPVDEELPPAEEEVPPEEPPGPAQEEQPTSSRKEKKKRKKRKEKSGSDYIEQEAQVSSDEEVSADERESDLDEQGNVEGLIADDEDEGPRRKKRKRRLVEQLAEDDLELVREATGKDFRPVDDDVPDEADDSRPLKRLRRGTRIADERQQLDAAVLGLGGVEPAERKAGGSGLAALADDESEDEDYESDYEGPAASGPVRRSKRKVRAPKHYEIEAAAEPIMPERVERKARGGGYEADGGEEYAYEELDLEGTAAMVQELFGDVSAVFGAAAPREMEEEERLEGEEGDEEERERRARREAERLRARPLEERLAELRRTLDPLELEKRFLTADDEEVRRLDVPERLQRRVRRRPPLTEADMEKELWRETDWILYNALKNRIDNPTLRARIYGVLRMIRVEHLEAPFIIMYRKDLWCHRDKPDESLSEGEIWTIDEWDEKWDALAPRKYALEQTLQRLMQAKLPDTDPAFAECEPAQLREQDLVEAIQTAQRQVELDDVQDAISAYEVTREQLRAWLRSKELKQAKRPGGGAVAEAKAEAHGEEEGMTEEEKRDRAEDPDYNPDVDDDEEEGAGLAALLQEPEPEEKQIKVKQEPVESKVKQEPKPQQQRRGVLKRSALKLAGLELEGLIKQMALPAWQFAENFYDGFSRYEPLPNTERLETLAAQYVRPGTEYSSVERVLAIARRVIVRRLAVEPRIRRKARELFWNSAVISTRPTNKGELEIDWLHEYALVKCIDRRPVSQMTNTLFATLVKAEQEGFITSTIDYERKALADQDDPDEMHPVLGQMRRFYCTDMVSSVASSYDKQRMLILRELWERHLKARCEEHVRSELLRVAHEAIVAEAAQKLRHMMTVAPIPLQSLGGVSGDERIVACVVGERDQPSYLAVLNRHGDVLDHLALHHLKNKATAESAKFGDAEKEQYQRKKADVEKLYELLRKWQPRMLLLDASSLECRYMKQELQERILKFEWPELQVEFVDPELARIYMNSDRSTAELPAEYPPLLRQAISLGRRALDPVAEFAYAWHTDPETNVNDLLALNLHPLQRVVPQPLLLRHLERTFMEVVNALGVDLNATLARPFRRPLLNFVAGLGPRKADLLFKYYVRSGNHIYTRRELLQRGQHEPRVKQEDAPEEEPEEQHDKEAKGVFGPVVWRNCVGFFKISQRSGSYDQDDEEDEVEHERELTEDEEDEEGKRARRKKSRSRKRRIFTGPLGDLRDTTRVHPEKYAELDEVVLSALAEEPEQNEEELRNKLGEEQFQARMVRKASHRLAQLIQPDKIHMLDELDLLPWIEEHEQQGVFKFYLINLIIDELKKGGFHTPNDLLRNPTSPLVRPWEPLSDEALFWLISGESPDTLKPGAIVTATVRNITPKGVSVRTDTATGLSGWIPIGSFSDQALPRDASDEENLRFLQSRTEVGRTVQARIVRVRHQTFSLLLTTRSSDLRPEDNPLEREWREQLPKDLLWDQYSLKQRQRRERELAEKQRRRFVERRISHEHFRNWPRERVVQELLKPEYPIGACFFRPSSSRFDHLTLTYKVMERSGEHKGEDELEACWDVDVTELDKPSPIDLGARLVINGEQYEDLDHIIATFLRPMVDNIIRLVKYSKFKEGGPKDIQEVLKADQASQGNKIVYGLAYGEKPGYFDVCCLLKDKVVRVPFHVTPKGYYFRKQLYSSPEKLCNAFKAYMMEKLKQGQKHIAVPGLSGSADLSRTQSTVPLPYAQPQPVPFQPYVPVHPPAPAAAAPVVGYPPAAYAMPPAAPHYPMHQPYAPAPQAYGYAQPSHPAMPTAAPAMYRPTAAPMPARDPHSSDRRRSRSRSRSRSRDRDRRRRSRSHSRDRDRRRK